MQIKLLHKGLLLVAIPLCFEITIFGILMNLQNKIEHEADIATRNKKINDAVNGILSSLFGLGKYNSRDAIFRPGARKVMQGYLAQIEDRFAELENLTQSEPELYNSVEECKNALLQAKEHILRIQVQLRQAQSPEESKEVLNSARKALDGYLNQTMTAGLLELANRSSQKANDAHSRDLRFRIQILLKAALTASFIVAITAAFLYSRNLSGRLLTLRENASRLAKSESLLPEMQGTDEISELDRSFHYAGELIATATKMRQEVSSMITHDLKTPVQSIRSFLEMLEHGSLGEVNAQGQALMKVANDESKRMLTLIDSLLQLEKLRSGNAKLKIVDLDIKELLDRCVNSIEMIATTKKIEIKRDYQSIEFEGDSFWLEQAFLNILSNAVKYSPRRSIVLITARRNGNILEVRVKDNGPGISESEKARIFEMFHRVEATVSQASGTGVGLTIAKELIELQNGTIRLESELGKGSEFILTIPVRANLS
jgi:signal transduction histidine kinase